MLTHHYQHNLSYLIWGSVLDAFTVFLVFKNLQTNARTHKKEWSPHKPSNTQCDTSMPNHHTTTVIETTSLSDTWYFSDICSCAASTGVVLTLSYTFYWFLFVPTLFCYSPWQPPANATYNEIACPFRRGWMPYLPIHKFRCPFCILLSGLLIAIIFLSSHYICLLSPSLIFLNLRHVSTFCHRLHRLGIFYNQFTHCPVIFPTIAHILVQFFNHIYLYMPIPGAVCLNGLVPVDVFTIPRENENGEEATSQLIPLSKIWTESTSSSSPSSSSKGAEISRVFDSGEKGIWRRLKDTRDRLIQAVHMLQSYSVLVQGHRILSKVWFLLVVI